MTAGPSIPKKASWLDRIVGGGATLLVVGTFGFGIHVGIGIGKAQANDPKEVAKALASVTKPAPVATVPELVTPGK